MAAQETATRPPGSRSRTVVRHAPRVRRFHAAIYSSVLLLALTGWWIYLGGEGHPSPLSRITGIADTRLHVLLGRLLLVLVLVPVFFGRKGIVRFLRESARIDRGDATWLLRWPRAIFTRRFEKHEGEFDPGQRIANFAIVGGVLVLVGTGIGMTMLHGGSLFALLAKLHLVAAFLLTVVLAGHILIASGVFPGYRGVWRSMHGGRVPEETAKRLWPEWTEDGEPTDL